MDDEQDGITRGMRRRLLSTGKIAGAAARLAARRAMGSSTEGDSIVAERLADELDQMKGMAMKLGQILSYFDGTFSPEVHAALQRLQRGAQPIGFAPMEEVFERELGMQVADAFESFDRAPVAAASIGQVYRATFEGRAVAVKIQYPGIRETIDGDFARLRGIARIASAATAVDGGSLVRELRERFVEECDYRREAAHQAFFREAFADEPRVRIPRVVEARSAGAVLTTEWCDGDEFYRFIAEASSVLCNEAARALVQFAFRSIFELRVLNADPHPGNYLFAPDAVVFLDFGCVRRFDPTFIAQQRRLMEVVTAGRREAFRDAVIDTGMAPRPGRFDFDAHWVMLRQCYAPYVEDHFRFTRGFIERGLELNGPRNPNARHLAIPPEWIWFQRVLWGLHSVLARMNAEGDFRAILREAWRRADDTRLEGAGSGPATC